MPDILNLAAPRSLKTRKTAVDVQSLTRRGAEARLAELMGEVRSLLAAFPELRQSEVLTDDSTTSPLVGRRAPSRKPVPAASKAVGVRSKKHKSGRRAAAKKR